PDRNPGAAGGDAHLLVVVAGAAAGGKGVAQPEVVLGGDAVGQVGEGGSALVGGYHQVRIVAIVAHRVRGRHDPGTDAVVSDVQQAANEVSVAGLDLGLDGFPVPLR